MTVDFLTSLQLGNFNNFCPLLAFDSYLLINLFDDSVKKNTSTQRPNFDAI